MAVFTGAGCVLRHGLPWWEQRSTAPISMTKFGLEVLHPPLGILVRGRTSRSKTKRMGGAPALQAICGHGASHPGRLAWVRSQHGAGPK